MGIQAPTTQDILAAILTALLSYNRPVILFIIFILSLITTLVITLWLTKKKVLISLVISLIVSSGATFLTALYFVITYIGKIRY